MLVDSHPGKTFTGTSGNDKFFGSGHADTFDMSQGGDDTVKAGGGDDVIYAGSTLTADDRLDGGEGKDTVELSGDYSNGLMLGPDTITNVESIRLDAGFDYRLAFNTDNVPSSDNFVVSAATLNRSNSVYIDTSTVSGIYKLVQMVGGGGDDTMIAGKSVTYMTGQGGRDLFVFGETSTHLDIADFNHHDDTIEIDASGVTSFEDLKLVYDSSNTFVSWQGHKGAIQLSATPIGKVQASDFTFGSSGSDSEAFHVQPLGHDKGFFTRAAELHDFL